MGIQLSFSACQKYLLSPFSYYLHYLLRLRPVEISSALIFGSALDEGLNALLAPPLTKTPERLQQAKNKFIEAWTKTNFNGEEVILSRPGAVKFSKTEIKECFEVENKEEGVDRTWAWMRHKGLTILEAYAEQVLPQLEEVYEVQSKVDLKNEVGDSFVGVVDLIAKINGKIWIIDNKSASVKYKEDSVRTSAQLSTYFEAKREQYDLAGAAYIVYQKKLRKKVPKVQIDIILDEINEGLIDRTFSEYDRALEGIKLGQFECSGNCRKQYWKCQYEAYCLSGGKDLTGLTYVDKK